MNPDLAYAFETLRKPIRWRALAPQSPVMSGYVNTLDELVNVAAASMRGWDVYIGLNHIPTDQRPLAKNVCEWEWLLVDLDPADGIILGPEDVIPVLDNIANLIGTELAPDILHTGNGIHIWLRLEQDVLVNAEQAQHCARRFLKLINPGKSRFQVDPSTGDLARIARLPGSINQRTGRMAQFIQAGQSKDAIPASRIVALSAGHDEPTSECEHPESDGTWRDVWSHLTATAQNFIEHGAFKGERHDRLWHTARKLRELGVGELSAWEALLNAAEHCDPMLDARDVRRVVRQEWSRDDFPEGPKAA